MEPSACQLPLLPALPPAKLDCLGRPAFVSGLGRSGDTLSLPGDLQAGRGQACPRASLPLDKLPVSASLRPQTRSEWKKEKPLCIHLYFLLSLPNPPLAAGILGGVGLIFSDGTRPRWTLRKREVWGLPGRRPGSLRFLLHNGRHCLLPSEFYTSPRSPTQ